MDFGTFPDHLGAWLAALTRFRRIRQLRPLTRELTERRDGGAAHPVGTLATYVDGFRACGIPMRTEDGLTLVPVRAVAPYLGWAVLERGDTWIALARLGGYVRLPLHRGGGTEYAALGDLSQLDAGLRFRRHPYVNRLDLTTSPARVIGEWP